MGLERLFAPFLKGVASAEERSEILLQCVGRVSKMKMSIIFICMYSHRTCTGWSPSGNA